MKILVSTTATQGTREGDFCFVPEGEIVLPGMLCDGDAAIMSHGTESDLWEHGCGCARSLAGLTSLTGTTTFKVALMDEARYWHAIRGSQTMKEISLDKDYMQEWERLVEHLLVLAAQHEVGAVLEIGIRNTLKARQHAHA